MVDTKFPENRRRESGILLMAVNEILTQFSLLSRLIYEGCPESIQPFWTSRDPDAWPWCILTASQRRPYCASVNSHFPVGLVSRQWDAVDWACVLCDPPSPHSSCFGVRLRLKCDGTRAETRFRLSAKRMSPFKSAGASVQSSTGSRGVRISGSNAGYTMFRGSVKSTGHPLHSSVSPSLSLPCVTVWHHISTGL
jgi:hypothetical protein